MWFTFIFGFTFGFVFLLPILSWTCCKTAIRKSLICLLRQNKSKWSAEFFLSKICFSIIHSETFFKKDILKFLNEFTESFTLTWLNWTTYPSNNSVSAQSTVSLLHCVKSVRIRSFSDPHLPSFGLNTVANFCI